MSQAQHFKLNHNKQSSLFTAAFDVGTPAQSTQMLIDLNGVQTYIFSQQSQTYLTRPHKFYKISESDTGFYVNMQKMYSSSSLGFQLQTQPIKDHTCVKSEGQDFCYDG